MQSIENKISDAVLKRIRELMSAPSHENGENILTEPHRVPGKVSIREAQFSDFERVQSLNQRLGQGTDSVENWRRLWRDNPALHHGGATASIGWVLEDSGEAVGFLGTIPLLYEYERRTLVAAATCRFAVEPAYRGFSHLLVVSFLRQKHVDLFVNSSATPAAGKIMMALKAVPIPQRNYGTVLFWVLKPRPFMKVLFRKLGVNSGFSSAGSSITSLALRGEMMYSRRMPRSKSNRYSVVESCVNEAGKEFDQFCTELTNETARLLARRTAEIMLWHFSPPGSKRVARILSCYSADRLMGYAVVRHEADQRFGLQRSIIADLLVRGDDPAITEQLMVAAYNNAVKAGSHVLEVMGFPSSIRQTLSKWNPYSREYPACPFFFKARDRALQEKLTNEDVWYACPFDGDATLWP